MQKPINVAFICFLCLALEGQLGRYIYITEWSVVWATVIPRLIVLDRTYVRPTQHVHFPYKHTQSTLSKTSTIIFATNQSRKNLRPRLTKANHVEVEGKVDSSIHQ